MKIIWVEHLSVGSAFRTAAVVILVVAEVACQAWCGCRFSIQYGVGAEPASELIRSKH